MKTDAIREAIGRAEAWARRMGHSAPIYGKACAQLTALEEEAELHDRLIVMQHERTIRASVLWQEAHDRPNTIPDLGDLVEWLLAQIAAKDEAISGGVANTKMLAQYLPGLYREDATAWEDLEAALSPQTGKALTDYERYITLGKAASRACDVMSEVLEHDLSSNDGYWAEMKAAKEGILAALLKD